MNLLLNTITVFCFAVTYDRALSEEFTCYGGSAEQGEDVYCKGFLNQPVCLICNISDDATAVRWYVNDQQLTQDQFNLREDHAGGILVNQCHSEKYSLRLSNPSTENNNATYSCVNYKKVLSWFILKLRAVTNLFINSTRLLNGKLIVHREDTIENVQCIIEGAIPPFTLLWTLNGVAHERKTFNYSEERFSSVLMLNISQLKTHSVIQCSSQGRYIIGENSSFEVLFFESKNDISKDMSQSYDVKWILVVSATVIVSVILIYSIVKGIKSHQIFHRENVLPNVSSMNRRENVPSMLDPYYYVEDFEGGANFELEDLVKDSCTTCFDSKISVNGLYEYWTGTYSIGGTVQGKCFAKQLSDQGTLQEASEFKTLARKLLALEKSAHISSVFSINIQEEPFSIVYEFLEFGSLRDFVMSRYQQSQTGVVKGVTINMKKQVQELLTFAVSVAKAMKFIESREFCHPFLSLKKVLLTSDCTCKLYDIRPLDMALVKVKEVLKKHNPPTPWTPPETIFLGEYTPTSDVWSFAVLLWELFTFGDTPYAGNTNAEIEQNVREGNILPQPQNCPGSVYDTMLLAWQSKSEMRPSFAVLHNTLKEISETSQGVDSSKRMLYSTVNRIGTECI